MPEDVTAEHLERQAAHWRALGPLQQALVAARVLEAGREAARLAVRHRHPGASEALVDWLTKALFVGSTVAERLYGRRPAQ